MNYIRNDGHDPKLQMQIQPNIGLDSNVRQAVVEILNHTLANELVLAAKTRSAHWNVSGAGFYELHILFHSQYKLLNNVSEKIAERIRMLGGIAIGSLQELINFTWFEEQPGVVPNKQRLLMDHEASISFLSDAARKCTQEYEDEGTYKLLVHMIRLHEKMAWMLRSHIEPELNHEEKMDV